MIDLEQGKHPLFINTDAFYYTEVTRFKVRRLIKERREEKPGTEKRADSSYIMHVCDRSKSDSNTFIWVSVKSVRFSITYPVGMAVDFGWTRIVPAMVAVA